VVVGIRGYRVLRVLDKVLGYWEAPYGKEICVYGFYLQLSRITIAL